MKKALLALPLALVLAAACSASDEEGDVSSSIGNTDQELKGCHGKASSTIPSSGTYYVTTFGNGPGDDGIMSCGTYTKHGSWYYAASRQRYGCGARIKIEANGKCVVAKTDDYGPDVCVENAAGGAIIDVSPLVTKELFGIKSAGWSDRIKVKVTKVASSTPLGPC